MTDPLSVTAGVVGLVTAGAQMITTLYSIGSAVKDAPHLAERAAKELADITVVLQQLHTYISGKARASIQRLNLITVEHITATLTGCVVTYSELDVVLKSLHADTGLRAWDRGLWYLKKDQVNSIVQRLQNHKATFSLMLNILQCASLAEAESNMDQLCDKVDTVLRNNQELSLRLRNIELTQTRHLGAEHVQALRADNHRAADYHTDAGAEAVVAGGTDDDHSMSSTGVRSDSTPPGRPSVDRSENAADNRASNFEELLHQSRVYRHVTPSDDAFSMISEARSTLAISICSSLTLGEVSNISVYAIPVYASELSNAHCYRFGSFGTPAADPKIVSPPSTTSSSPERSPSAWRTFFKRQPRSAKTPAMDPVPARVVFGVKLDTSVRYANVAISLFNEQGQSYIYGYVPIVVAKCGVLLKEKGTETQDIFAISGNLRHLKELQERFDSPPRYGKGFDWTGYTVHDAANMLLRYLLQLPEPVIPLRFYERFREPLRTFTTPSASCGNLESANIESRTFDDVATTSVYQSLLTELDSLSRQLLLYMLDMLAVFNEKSALNRMTTSRLAVIFQPAFLSHPDHTALIAERRLSEAVVCYLVEHQDNFIIGMDIQSTANDSAVTRTSDTGIGVRRMASLPNRRGKEVQMPRTQPHSPLVSSVPPRAQRASMPELYRSNTVPTRRSKWLD